MHFYILSYFSVVFVVVLFDFSFGFGFSLVLFGFFLPYFEGKQWNN